MTQNGPVFGSTSTPGTVIPSTTDSCLAQTSATATEIEAEPARSDACSSKQPKRQPDLHYHAVSLADYFFHVGYLGQNWTDIHFSFFDTSVSLHRIILARCPYLHRLIHNTAPGQSIHLSFTDENITAASVHIALQSLYRPCPHLINSSNARAILVTALLFEGMPELAQQAYIVARESILPDSITDLIEWLDAKDSTGSNGYTNGGDANGHSDLSSEWASQSRYGEYSANLKNDVLDYLIHSLPVQIPPSNPHLTAIYSRLPYPLFKLCVEHPDLPVGAMQDRFSFAKKVLVARKKLGVGVGPIEETVALGFKEGSSGVEVNKKAKKGRQFFKIEGN